MFFFFVFFSPLPILTGMEISTSSGGVSRDPSAAAYVTAKAYVLSHSTSRADERKEWKFKQL